MPASRVSAALSANAMFAAVAIAGQGEIALGQPYVPVTLGALHLNDQRLSRAWFGRIQVSAFCAPTRCDGRWKKARTTYLPHPTPASGRHAVLPVARVFLALAQHLAGPLRMPAGSAAAG